MLRKLVGTCLMLALATAISASAQTGRDPNHTERAMDLKIVNGPRVEGVGADWAVIAWTTNTGGSTVVHYGTDPNRLNETAESPYADNDKTVHQSHRVHLKNLKPGTTYYFVADSGQGEGTGTAARSSVDHFTTKER